MRREERELYIENMDIYMFYVNRLVTLTLSQFEWHDLPDTCDPRYFERQLLYKGTASFFKPKDIEDIYSLGYVQKSGFTGYGYPAGINPIDFNGHLYETDDYEIIYDNVSRGTIMPFIYLYAKKLYEVDQTIRANLMQQNTPYIIPSTPKNSVSIKQFFKNFFAFSPVLTVKKMEYNPLNELKTVDLRVDFKGNELYDLKENIWSEALHILGIAPSKTKKERLITGEIIMDRQEDIVSIQSRLLQRIRFCDKINQRWGLNVSVNPVILEDNVKELTDPFGNQNNQDIFGNRSEMKNG